jgi:hypothetical protein
MDETYKPETIEYQAKVNAIRYIYKVELAPNSMQ